MMMATSTTVSILLLSLLLISQQEVESFSSQRKQLEDDVNKFEAKNWSNRGSARGSDTITPVFLIQRDASVVAKFEKQLLDVSNPKSPNYGKWLSKQQIVTQFAPTADKLALIQSYLAYYNISSNNIKASDYQDKIFVKMSVTTASQMFQTSFATFSSTIKTNTILIRATAPYSLPADVASAVALVDDLIRLPDVQSTLSRIVPQNKAQMKEAASFGTCSSCPSSYISPSVLQQTYSYTPLTGTPAPGNGVAVAEFQNQYYDQTDLDNFNSACGTSVSLYCYY